MEAGRKSQRLVTNDVKAFAQKYAEENLSLSNDAEVEVLTKACYISRRRTLEFMKCNNSKIGDVIVGEGDDFQN